MAGRRNLEAVEVARKCRWGLSDCKGNRHLQRYYMRFVMHLTLGVE